MYSFHDPLVDYKGFTYEKSPVPTPTPPFINDLQLLQTVITEKDNYYAKRQLLFLNPKAGASRGSAFLRWSMGTRNVNCITRPLTLKRHLWNPRLRMTDNK